MQVVRKRFGLVGIVALGGCFSPLEVVIDDGGNDRVRGSGISVTETRRVAGFSAVAVSGAALVIIDRTGRESLTITADHNILPLLSAEVRGGRLHLGTRRGYSISPRTPIEYRLTVRDLDDIEASGATEVDAAGIDTGVLGVALSGASTATIAGLVRRQEVTVSGAASYFAEDLLSRVAIADVSGGAYALFSASDLLDVRVSGAALVEYMGRPEIRASVSGAARIRPY